MKNSKVKILTAVLAVAGVASLLGSCGSTKTSGGDGWVAYDDSKAMTTKTTINYWTGRTDLDSDGTFAKYIAEFNKVEPNITVKVTSYTDYVNTVDKALAGGSYGDVSMITITDMTQLPNYYISYGAADSLKSTGLYRDEYLYAKSYKGNVYGLAYMNTVSGVAYNKQVFSDAGVDASTLTTPEKFIAGMQKIKDSDNGLAKDCIPYYTNAKNGWTADAWEDNFVNNVITGDKDYANTHIAVDTNVWKKGTNDPHYEGTKLYFDLIAKSLTEDDPTTTDWESCKAKINNGQIGAMCFGNWCITQFQAAGDHPENIGYMAFPFTSTDGKTQYVNSSSDYCYGISNKIDDTHKEASERFVTWMVQKSGLAVNQGGISIMKSDPFPSTLSSLENCTLLVSNPAKSGCEDARSATESSSKQTLYDSGARFSKVVTDATLSGKTYDEKLVAFDADAASWNSAWSTAAAKVLKTYPDCAD
ncbi:MAG: ABC transporter substrate-binding protein [Bacilli bacterium]